MQTIAPYAVIVLALMAANLPFSNVTLSLWRPLWKRWAVRFRGRPFLSDKPFWLCALEWALFGGLCAVVAIALERRLNLQNYSQGWEFYAVIIIAYTVMAFPGFAYKYLWRARLPQPSETTAQD